MSPSESPYLLSVSSVEAWLCKRLEAVRLSKNINQTELAQRAGVSRRTISRMENGQGISLETLIRVLRALGLEQNLEMLVPEVGIQPIDRVREKGQSHDNARHDQESLPKKCHGHGVTSGRKTND